MFLSPLNMYVVFHQLNGGNNVSLSISETYDEDQVKVYENSLKVKLQTNIIEKIRLYLSSFKTLL